MSRKQLWNVSESLTYFNDSSSSANVSSIAKLQLCRLPCFARVYFCSTDGDWFSTKIHDDDDVHLPCRWKPERMKSKTSSWRRSWSSCWQLDTSEPGSRDCHLLIRYKLNLFKLSLCWSYPVLRKTPDFLQRDLLALQLIFLPLLKFP